MRSAALFLLSSLIVRSQTFEVAAIKPSAPPIQFSGREGGPGSSDPGRVRWSNSTLKALLTFAYNMQSYQIEGPEWLNIDMFDVTATLPLGATRDQMRVMVQNLLAERFGMRAHRDRKEMPSYVLTVSKGGPRMKLSGPENQAAAEARRGPPPMGKDGFPEIAAFGKGVLIQFRRGAAKLTCNRCSIPVLTEQLAQQLDKPVTDSTGLTDTYDFTLVYEPEFRAGPGMVGPPPAPPGGADGEPASPLQSAIQAQLGLKLEAKKSSVDIVVIDSIEKMPTGN